jgi:hypothetical protein
MSEQKIPSSRRNSEFVYDPSGWGWARRLRAYKLLCFHHLVSELKQPNGIKTVSAMQADKFPVYLSSFKSLDSRPRDVFTRLAR